LEGRYVHTTAETYLVGGGSKCNFTSLFECDVVIDTVDEHLSGSRHLLLIHYVIVTLYYVVAPCGLGVVRIDPFRFLAGCRTRATKPGLALSVVYLGMCIVLFIRAPFYVLLVFVVMCSVFWLFWLN